MPTNSYADDFNPLVSIVVITYNSSDFVLETLESAKKQTYKNIELIVSDDCSKDNTVEICAKWLSENNGRFSQTKLLTAENNTGTSGNCNRGINASRGIWIKIIAGDDILLPECIALNVSFSIKNNSCISFSKMNLFRDNTIFRKENCDFELKRFIKKSQKEKTKSYIRNPIFLNIPTLFFSKELITKLEGFNENFRLLEDQPFILKVLLNSYNILFLNETTVNYRVHGGSITGAGNINFIRETYKCYQLHREPFLDNRNLLDLIFKAYIEVSFYFKLKGWVRTIFYRVFVKTTSFIRLLS